MDIRLVGLPYFICVLYFVYSSPTREKHDIICNRCNKHKSIMFYTFNSTYSCKTCLELVELQRYQRWRKL